MNNISRRKVIQSIGGGLVAAAVTGPAQAASRAASVINLSCYAHKYTYYPGDRVELRYNMESTYSYWVDSIQAYQTDDVLFTAPFNFGWELKDVTNGNVITSGTATLPARYPVQPSRVDQNWPVSLAFQLPANLKPGIYVVQPIGGGPATPVYVRTPRGQAKPDLLVVISSNTGHAYGNYGGKSTYVFNSTNKVAETMVSFRRPINLDAQGNMADLSAWINANYSADYVTDFEMHTEADLLTGYKCVILTKHNEYYTRDMYNRLKTYQERGGNVANLAGNSIWFIVTYINNNTAMLAKTGDNFYFYTQGRSSRFILGNHFENVGGMPSVIEGGTAYNTHHWLYDGTGVRNGDMVGEQEAVNDYEYDGVTLRWSGPNQTGQPSIAPNAGIDPSYVILSVSMLKKSLPTNTTANWTVGAFDTPHGGQVFNGATINWASAFAPRFMGQGNYLSPLPIMTGNFLRAVTNTQVFEFRAPNPVRKPGNPLADNGFMYIYLKREEFRSLPQRRLNGLLVITLNGLDWVETHTRITFPIQQRAGALPIYKHKAVFKVPGTRLSVYKEVFSRSATAPAGWQSSGIYAYGFETTAAGTRTVYTMSDNRVPGVSQRLSVRNTSQSPEVMGIASFNVY